MENFGEGPAYTLEGSGTVEREVAGFFRDLPFLLVSERRLAALLCRPLGMVVEAVRVLEEEGFLTRKGEDTLVCAEGNLAEVQTE